MTYPLQLPSNKPMITVTHPTSSLWVIEMHNGADSRLTSEFIKSAMSPALNVVERDWRETWRAQKSKDSSKAAGRGALIIVGNRSQHKFFSNGLDYENAIKDPFFFPDTFNPMLRRLLTFPIPTVAAINGHCFAGGMMLSLCCDYRVMADGAKRNTWMCMNEVHFGAAWPYPFSLIARAKVTDAAVLRKIALEGYRFTPQEALKSGLVDAIAPGDTAGVLAKAQEVAEAVSDRAKPGAWGLIRSGLVADAIRALAEEVPRSTVALDDIHAKSRL